MVDNPTVSVVGMGYIGLPTAVLMANAGIRIQGVDVNRTILDRLKEGAAHIREPGLDDLVQKVVASGMLTVHDALQPADIYFICVPTPVVDLEGEHLPDMGLVKGVAKEIGRLVKDGDIVILESTSPVGATTEVHSIIAEVAPRVEFNTAYCPERVLPGQMLKEFEANPRIIGCDDADTAKAISVLYSSFTNAELRLTSTKTAEMCKLAENAYRDVNIAFANELSVIAEAQGVDVWELRQLANLHPRVNILTPGPGVGGHCIAVDPWFLVAGDPANTKLIRAARTINDLKPEWVKMKCQQAIESFLSKAGRPPKIALYGIAFKPDVDDFRGSPAMQIARDIIGRYESTVVVEPYATPGLGLPLTSLRKALETADLHIALVGHNAFKGALCSALTKQELLLIDFCGITRS